MKVVHYLNQFFAGLGGEQAASAEPVRLHGAIGPGRGLGIEIVQTFACGDDYFGEHEESALGRLLGWLEEDHPDVLVCGPAFDAGRYGYACGVLAREAARRGFAVVSGMHPENPGVLAAEGGAYIVPTGATVTSMKETLPKMAALTKKVGSGEPVGPPDEEGYLPRGLRRNQVQSRTGAERTIDMLLSKLAGHATTEVEPPADTVAPPDPVPDLRAATIALVTESGFVPKGNPDGLPSRRSHVWLRYPLGETKSFDPTHYQTVHGGFDTTAANDDPNRLVPLDAVRELETEGRIGRLFGEFYTTTGVDTPIASAARFGQEIAKELKDAGVEAVLLTGTCGTGTRCGSTLAKEIERTGIPAVFVTALPTIATMVGANRILRGVSITHPTGDPELSATDEAALRKRIVERAIEMLETDVGPRTVWELEP